jgi:ribosomal protein L3
MNLKNLNVLLIIVILFSSSALMAQSKVTKKKDSKEQVVDAKSADQEEETVTVYTYIILDLKGKEGTYSAEMVIPKNNQHKMTSEQTVTAEKKAAYAAQQQTYATEIDFLKTMQDQMMELIAVTNDQGREGPFKRFYFRRKVEIRK